MRRECEGCRILGSVSGAAPTFDFMGDSVTGVCEVFSNS